MNDVKEMLAKYDGDLCNICYKIIEDSVDLEMDFKLLCESWNKEITEPKNLIDTYISKEERNLINKLYGKKVEGILSEIITKVNYGIIEQDEFYAELLHQLKINFSVSKELAVAFEKIVQDRRMPFRYLGKPMSMESEEYKEYIDKNLDNINKILYILKFNYNQKTQEASVILNVLESIENYEDKVVVLSQMIDLLKRSSMAGMIHDLIVRKEVDDYKE